MTNLYKRNIGDAVNMLTLAKQNSDEVNPITQVFYYPSQTESCEKKNNLRLMALDEEFIKKLEDGERLIFKGCDEEKLVLCTDNETYEVKEGEVSNSLLLCPNLMFKSDIEKIKEDNRVLKEQKVCGIYHNYLELRLTFPRFQKLRSILRNTEYLGPTAEDKTHKGYYLSELLDEVQCSREQLLPFLKEIKALYYEDKWRVVNLEYLTEVMSYIITLMEKQNWAEINASECKEFLQSLVPEFIIDYILKNYAVQKKEDNNIYYFIEEEVSKCFAEIILKTGEGKFRYNEFIKAWEQCLKPVIKPDIKFLKGLALIEKNEGRQQIIYLFPERDLPENIGERFRLLFKRKEKWNMDEITPYIEKLATKAMNVKTMLTKFARASTVDGINVFSAKYAK